MCSRGGCRQDEKGPWPITTEGAWFEKQGELCSAFSSVLCAGRFSDSRLLFCTGVQE